MNKKEDSPYDVLELVNEHEANLSFLVLYGLRSNVLVQLLAYPRIIIVRVHCFHAERYTMRMINSINKYLFSELGYKGATNYLDPDNSCINMVLKRREGNVVQSAL